MENKYESLEKLKSLLDSGILTQEEFNREKEKILGESASSFSYDTKHLAQEKSNTPSTKPESRKGIIWLLLGLVAVLFYFSFIHNGGSGSLKKYREIDNYLELNTDSYYRVGNTVYCQPYQDFSLTMSPWQKS